MKKRLDIARKTGIILSIVAFPLIVLSQVPENWTGKVMTVNGIMPANLMGITLPHEHLLIVHKYNYLDLTNESDAINELGYFANAGGKTLFEASAIGIGRNPEGLKRISTATGVNVVMCAGYYKDNWIPDSIKNKSIEQLTETIINDILFGIGGIHAGFIKVAVSRPITQFEEKSIRAAARAQKATGVALEVHFDGDLATVEQKHYVLDVFENEGVDLTRVILDHAVPYVDLGDDFISLAKRRCNLAFDMLGLEVRVAFQHERELPETLKALFAAGYIDQIMMSQDVCFSVCYVKNGGYGYGHILNNIVPQLKASGITDEQIHTMMVENPERIFPFKNSTNDVCEDETYTAAKGTVTDNSGSSDYPDNITCSKLIQPSSCSTVTLSFNEFNTESGYDILTVYDGSTTSSPLLGQFSGTTIPPVLTSTGNSMLIVFQTDGGVRAAGWSANYSGNFLNVIPAARSISSESGNTDFTVTSSTVWSVNESSAWLTAAKTTDTTLTITYDENTSINPRSAEITVTGTGVPSKTILIDQRGASPMLGISPETKSQGSASGITAFIITSNIDWSASESSDWLTAAKTNDSILTITYDENTSINPRSAEITLSGEGVSSKIVILDQSGARPLLSVNQESVSESSASGTINFIVTSNMDWSVKKNSDWLTATKKDASTLLVSYEENVNLEPRSAEITLGDKNLLTRSILINQRGADPSLYITPGSISIGCTSGTTALTVTSNIDWSVSESSKWLAAIRTEASVILVIFDENKSVDSRMAEITVSGEGVLSRVVTIIQEGAIPSAAGEQSETRQINVFPNPVSNKAWVTYPEMSAELIEIYNPSGELILRIKNPGKRGETEIDLSGFKNGFYTYRIIDQEGKIHNGKIMKY